MKPYKEVLEENVSLRTFSQQTDEDEFVWHRDREDRTISVTQTTDWLFQLDNELPVKLVTGKSIFIPRGIYHRIIKGTGDITVTVLKHT